MGMTTKVAIPFPIFDPNRNPTRQRPLTEIRFSRWNNAHAVKLNERGRTLQEIEDEIRRTRRFDSADNIANTAATESSSAAAAEGNEIFKSVGTPSTPSRPSIPGKKSKYSKPPPKPEIRVSNFPNSKTAIVPFRPGPSNVKISDDGVSYVVDGAPFEFRYSYTETPTAKPVKMREPPFVPFGPSTMPRPWTGRNPLPPGKLKKLKEFNSLVLPSANVNGLDPVLSPDPFKNASDTDYVKSREEILGEQLTKEEINELVKSTMKTTSQLNIGRDGLTHNMLENIHTHWKRRRVCKIKCIGVCTVDMDNVCQQLEERTGGKIIYRKAGTVYLFRGRNYNYSTRPCFPMMLWKPVSPVYPKLIKQVPEGLTLEKVTEMRQKGMNLIPMCKLGKNGVYCELVTNIREAFEVCELVRINCQELNASDYRRIGGKLKDLVPCVLLSFEDGHILMWRGQHWRSALPNLSNDGGEVNEINIDSENSNTLLSDAQQLSEPRRPEKNSAEHHPSNEFHEVSISSSSDDVSLRKVKVPCPTENSNLPVPVVTDATSLTLKTYEVETTGVMASTSEPQPGGSISPSITMIGTRGNSNNDIVDPHTDKLQDGSGAADIGRPSMSVPCTQGVLLLLEQAVEKGSALVLDDESLDADHIYQTAVDFAKSAPPEPVFRLPRKVIVQESYKQEGLTLRTQEIALLR